MEHFLAIGNIKHRECGGQSVDEGCSNGVQVRS
jgi:hypothetical protein